MGINIAFPDLVFEGDGLQAPAIGLCADAQIEDDGPKMETYHEGTYRCSCVGHAYCRPDVRSPRECGPSVPGQLIVRILTATDDKPRSVTEGPDRAYRH